MNNHVILKSNISRNTITTDSKIVIYTDGSCINDGPFGPDSGSGGYSAVMVVDGETYELSGECKDTTSSRMKMSAVIAILEILGESDNSIELLSDAQFMINAINEGLVNSWREKGWKKSGKKPVQNVDLWEKLLEHYGHFPNSGFKWASKNTNNSFQGHAAYLAIRAARGEGKFRGGAFIG